MANLWLEILKESPVIGREELLAPPEALIKVTQIILRAELSKLIYLMKTPAWKLSQPAIKKHGPARKRTHKLSNGEIIWDFSGNIWEWIKDENQQEYGNKSFISQVTRVSHPLKNTLSQGRTTRARNAKNQFGPYGDYTTLSEPPYGGLGKGLFDEINGAVIRGGYWGGNHLTGIFASLFNISTSDRYTTLGFRCVYIPNVPYPQVSIETAPSLITSENAGQVPISGTCSEEGLPVLLNAKELSLKSICSQGRWEVYADLTRFHEEPNVTLEANHNSAYNLGALRDTITIENRFSCPPNFVSIPSRKIYTQHSFCVSKYEMKKEGSNGINAHPFNFPYTNISREKAILKCVKMGDDYDLITNDQWQSIASNIELVSHNWGGGYVSSTEGINQGHSDNSPSTLLEASYDNQEACLGTEQICDANSWNKQKRTHILSNKQIIWDFSGNAREWVKDINNHKYGPNAYMSKVLEKTHTTSYALSRGTTNTTRTAKSQFGPRLNYQFSPQPIDNGFRLGYGELNANGGAVIRGGSLSDIIDAGIFATDLSQGTKDADPLLGFRCVYHTNRSTPRVSIDNQSIKTIKSSNVSEFTISGECSENEGPIDVNIGGIKTSSICSNGFWSASLDLTNIKKSKDKVSIIVNHASTDGRSSFPDKKFVQNKFICPPNYIGVPAMSDYTTHSFCISKYEMKENFGNKVVSRPRGLPIVSISRTDAINSCQDLGELYDLVTNDEWQSIARNIEMVPSNWQYGNVGKGGINLGHSDGSPNERLPASSDNDPCYLTEETCDHYKWHNQKRTHTLSNSEVIWDLAGNVIELVKDLSDSDYLSPPGKGNSYISKIMRGSHPTLGSLQAGLTVMPRVAKDQFGPIGDYKGLQHGNFGGLGYAWFDSEPNKAIVRGGVYDAKPKHASGIFTVSMSGSTNSEANFLGFRCVYRP